ncbi:hypothetical protein ACFC1T_09355 [Kitasatospora sp. NPDC056076]|uniref:hypothetical protein n=1 Tax=Kitasatospora sp. NPDC056076 TaxID=3345703 RepID=UPI0035E040C1
MVNNSSPANQFRTKVGQWAQEIPNGGEWRSLGPAFLLFLMQLGQKANPDGTNIGPNTVGGRWLAKATRVSPDSVTRYYLAAEAAGVVALNRTQAGRIRGYAVLAGAKPDWNEALPVLRGDRRRLEREATRARQARAGEHASELIDHQDDPPVDEAVDNAQMTARAGFPMPARADNTDDHETAENPARADIHLPARAGFDASTCGPNQVDHYQDPYMADVVGEAQLPGDRASVDNDASHPEEVMEQHPSTDPESAPDQGERANGVALEPQKILTLGSSGRRARKLTAEQLEQQTLQRQQRADRLAQLRAEADVTGTREGMIS